jgi:hypothetical protein
MFRALARLFRRRDRLSVLIEDEYVLSEADMRLLDEMWGQSVAAAGPAE